MATFCLLRLHYISLPLQGDHLQISGQNRSPNRLSLGQHLWQRAAIVNSKLCDMCTARSSIVLCVCINFGVRFPKYPFKHCIFVKASHV